VFSVGGQHAAVEEVGALLVAPSAGRCMDPVRRNTNPIADGSKLTSGYFLDSLF
jgi:hypothetical protein